MKPISSKKIVYEPLCIGRKTSSIVEDILRLETEPYNYLEKLFTVIAEYYNHLVDHSQTRDETFSALEETGRKYSHSFYSNKPNVEEIRQILAPYENQLRRNIGQRIIIDRHISGNYVSTQNWALNLFDWAQTKNIDTVVNIATGAFEPACLLAEMLEVDNLQHLRYSQLKKFDSTPKIIEPKNFGKRVLVIDDFCWSGESLAIVATDVKKNSESDSEVYATSIFKPQKGRDFAYENNLGNWKKEGLERLWRVRL